MNTEGKRIIGIVILSSVLAILLYIFFHECGHLLVMLSAGTRIDEFSILTAHVSGHGGNYTESTELWLHANGALFPLFLSYFYVLIYNSRSCNAFYRIFSFFIALVPLGSMLAWVVIPVLYLFQEAPRGDDVTLFLDHFSRYGSPVFVSIGALLLLAFGVFLMVKKKVLQNCIDTVAELRPLPDSR